MERDFLGELELPPTASYGIQTTQAGMHDFQIFWQPLSFFPMLE
jgi:aspartate ammonia-lyase